MEKVPKKNFSEEDIKGYMTDLTSGLLSIHSNHYLHGDLKPENIIRFKNKTLKICDFGSSMLSDKSVKKGKPSK